MMIRRNFVWLVPCLGLACSSPSATTPADASTGGEPMSSSGLPATASTSGETTTAETTTSGTPSSTGPSGPPDHVPPGFLNPLDAGNSTWECSQWLEDCPVGEKCMPYSDDGGSSFTAMRCVPVAADPAQPGEPCTVEDSSVSGIDTCDFHSMCWDVDPETLEGICVAMCIGTESDPTCAEANHTCSVNGDGTLSLCLPICDPLAQDCDPGDACYAVDFGYVCAPDASGDQGEPFSPCEFLNGCDPGSVCALSPECPPVGSPRCCVPYCALSDPDCPDTTSCIPVIEPGDEPIGLEDVGICGGEP